MIHAFLLIMPKSITKNLSSRTEAARRSTSLQILLGHSRSLKVTQGHSKLHR